MTVILWLHVTISKETSHATVYLVLLGMGLVTSVKVFSMYISS